MTPPINTKEVCALIDIFNYYGDIWARLSHLLHPLTALTSPKVKFKLTGVEYKAFDNIKRTIIHDTLLSYMYFNKFFDIHMDASDYQLGSVISQNGKPIAFYSRTLTETEIELFGPQFCKLIISDHDSSMQA